MGSLGPFEIALIFLVILLVFGAKRIPEIARGLGKGIREFKSATKDISREFNVENPPNRIQPPAQGTVAPRVDDYQAAPQPVPAQQPAAQPAPVQQPAPAPQPVPAQQPAPAPQSPPPAQPPTSSGD
jgi:sec-independent protein translocase protein TatA